MNCSMRIDLEYLGAQLAGHGRGAGKGGGGGQADKEVELRVRHVAVLAAAICRRISGRLHSDFSASQAAGNSPAA